MSTHVGQDQFDMKCIGRTKGKRCNNETPYVFCSSHKWQPLIFAFTVISVLAVFSGLYQDLIKPLIEISSTDNTQPRKVDSGIGDASSETDVSRYESINIEPLKLKEKVRVDSKENNVGKKYKESRIEVNLTYYLEKYENIISRYGSGGPRNWENLYSEAKDLLCNSQLDEFVEQRVVLSNDYGTEVGYEINKVETTEGELSLVLRYLSTCLKKDEYYGTCVHVKNYGEGVSLYDEEVTYRIFGEFGLRNPNSCRT